MSELITALITIAATAIVDRGIIAYQERGRIKFYPNFVGTPNGLQPLLQFHLKIYNSSGNARIIRDLRLRMNEHDFYVYIHDEPDFTQTMDAMEVVEISYAYSDLELEDKSPEYYAEGSNKWFLTYYNDRDKLIKVPLAHPYSK